MSSASWSAWVTAQRQEFSRRLKSVPLTSESASSSWPTVTTRDYKDCGENVDMAKVAARSKLSGVVAMCGRADPANPSSAGSRQESWATPKASDPERFINPERSKNLNDQVPAQAAIWGTPRTGIMAEVHYSYDRGKHNIEEQAGASIPGGGKLNPRWVETLMGLPVGWTMPSCSSPLTTAPTSYDCSETESCPPPQSELS
jgi:hypothetical protein